MLKTGQVLVTGQNKDEATGGENEDKATGVENEDEATTGGEN